MQSLALAAPLVLALVLALSGVAKLRSPRAAADSFISLRMPRWLSNSIAPRLLPWGELVLAAALLALPGILGVAASIVTLALMLVYLAVIVRALGFDEPVECGCFGELGLGEVDRRTLWRNVILVLFGVLALVAAVLDDRSPIQRWWQAAPVHWAWLLVSLALVALVALVLGQGKPGTPPSPSSDELLDYQRQPTPFVELTTADGGSVTLRDLARQQAQLLLFVNNHCGPCLRVSGQVDEWTKQLAPAVAVRAVYAVAGLEALDTSDPRVALAAPNALFDPQRHLAQLLETHSTPAAVLFGADDMLAGGPVVGEDAVQQFVDDIRAELGNLDSPA